MKLLVLVVLVAVVVLALAAPALADPANGQVFGAQISDLASADGYTFAHEVAADNHPRSPEVLSVLFGPGN